MKKLLPIVLACLCWCGYAHSQLVDVVVSQKVHDGADGSMLAGQTTYRIFAQVENPTDFLTEVQGSDVYPLDISTSSEFYRNGAHGNEQAGSIGSFLLGLPGFGDLRYSSGVTIGLINDAAYGIPFEENELGEVAGQGGGVTTLQDSDNPWIPGFLGNGDIVINTFVGGAWFSLNGGFNQGSNLNGYGVGVNNSVCLGQFTTDGDFSYNINTQVLENLEEGGNIQHLYRWSEDPGLGLTFPIMDEPTGCTNETACNFDEEATEDDGSCEFDSCAGCTDELACNYDENATISDDSCLQLDCNGECGGTAVIDDCEVCGGDNSSCTGCTNEAACNFDENATISDDSCIVVNGGEISTASETATCSGDGVDDVVAIDFTGVEGPNSLFVITEENLDIVGISETNEINLEGAPAGICLLWHLSYGDDVSLDITNAGDLAGCFDLSNSITVTRSEYGCTNPEALNFDADACDLAGDDAVCEFDDLGPANDLCVNATEILVDGDAVAGDNTDANDENDATENNDWLADGEDGDVWFSFEGNGGLVTIETFCGSNTDTQIAIYDSCEAENSLVSDEDSGVAPSPCQFMSLITDFCTEEGAIYYIEVEGWNGTTGDFTIGVTSQDAVLYCADETAVNFEAEPADCAVDDITICEYELLGCTDEAAFNFNELATEDDGSCQFNDTCDTATAISCGDTATGNTVGASTEDLEGCFSSVSTAPGVWYTLLGEGDLVEANTNGSTYDTKLGVYSGSCDDLTCISTNDDGGIGTQSLVNFTAEEGVTYYLYVTGFSANAGDYILNVTCTPIVEGCTDDTACNFDETANTDDDSCFSIGDACDDENPNTDGDVYVSCEVCQGIDNAILGCTNAEACNFNPDANVDDGSCESGTFVYIPTEVGSFGPALLLCTDNEAPEGYVLADQDCGNEIIANDPFCLNTFWDSLCQDDYEACLGGCELDCPADVILECGSDTSVEALGMAVYADANLCDGGDEITFSDEMSGDLCVTTIERTFTGSFGATCTQTILVTDSQGPVFPEVEDVNVQCVEEIPAPLDLTAVDACTGEEVAADVFIANTGVVSEECDLFDAIGPGADWSVWLQGFGPGASDNFVWDADGGSFVKYADGTARLTGTVVNDTDASQGWIVDLWFENGQDWDSWSALGRWYKDDLGFGADHFEDWMYYEMVGNSTLTGIGSFDGDQLLLTHDPESFFFGFQCGIGANNKNANEGFSGWFNYSGNVGGLPVSGNGDVNVDKECEDGEPVGECPDGETTYVYRAIDACGNATVVTQVITNSDTTPPVFVDPPADMTVSCEEGEGELVECVATDNCVGEITYTEEEVITPGLCDNTYTVVRTWTATDICGNSAEHMQTIEVVDNEAPVITCPENITHSCEETPDYGMATATDNCTELPSVTMEESTEGDSCGSVITRVYTATDECGNTSTCTQTITIFDDAAPVFDPFTPYLSVECSDSDSVTADVTATDNCNEVTITFEDQLNSGGCLGVVERTYTAVDACGNTATAIQYISLQDTTDPVITCPEDLEHQCDETPDYGMATATDNCGLDVTITMEESTEVAECITTITRTYTATDYCDNVSTCTQTITIVDTTAPVLTIPADLTVECGEEADYGTPSATDNCDEDVEIELTETVEPGICDQNSVITRVYRAFDDCGNEAVATQTITLQDTTAPVITCPADLTADCADTAMDYGTATAEDLCSEVTITSADETAGDSCETVITRTWTATDACGNASSCVQTITIVDTTAPVITCPEDITHECDETPDYGMATATDDCQDAAVTMEEVTTGDSCETIITRTYTATDGCGNASSCVQTITIVDTTPPVITGAVAISMPCDNIMTDTTITCEDNCNEVNDVTTTFTDQTVSGGCAGQVIRTYVCTDACGNSSEFVQIIDLFDDVDPVIECAPDASIECGEDMPEMVEPTASDNCGQVTLTSEVTEEGDACLTTVTRTWTATDDCGNSSSCSQVITITDTTAPVITCPDDVTADCAETTMDYGTATAEDTCNEVTVTSSDEVTGDSCESLITRTWTATDACGNASSCVQTITITDTTAPVITCPADVTYECDAIGDSGAATATDDCNEVTITSSDVTTGDDCETVITRTWTATDACGNSSECTQTITIVDTTAPVIEGEIEFELECDDEAIDNIYVTATDNCNDVTTTITFDQVFVSGGCANVQIIRTYTATDGCGNSSEFVQIIDLIDTTPPTIVCGDDIAVQCNDEMPMFTAPEASDNCTDVTVTFTDEMSQDDCTTTTTRTWVATDECGNTATCSQSISITDTEAPVLTCPADLTHECDETPDYGMATAEDACGSASVTMDESTSGDSCETVITRTYTATDECGNTSECTQTITILDSTAPELTVPADVTYECNESPETGMATATDNCNEVTVTSSDEMSGDICEMVITRTWTATDACGNATSADQTITIVDTTAPVITCPADVTYECDAIGDSGVATATDDCDDDVQITSSDSTDEANCGSVITRTWTATDACGNASSCVQTISIVDTTAPVAAVQPEDVTIECGEELPVFTPEWSDNCDLELTLEAISAIGGDSCEEFIDQAWTATDNCGNSTTVSRTITIVDTTAPVITCPADATADCSDTAMDYGMATAEDSCNEVTITSSDETSGDSCETVITRTWTATDACGNTSSCVQTITITDTTAPVLTIPADVTVECSDLVDAGMATATDDCNEVTVTSSDVTTGDDCESVITRTWTATDACGNATSADQTITIVDTTAPVFGTVPGDQNYQCLSDVPAQVNPTATDNCQVAMVTCTQVEDLDDCGNGTITVLCEAADGCGNVANTSYVITILDTEAPMLTSMPADLVLDCEDEVPAADEVDATDNCDEDVTVTFSEVTIGDNSPVEGSIATCALFTPTDNVCTANPDGWALKLFDQPGNSFFTDLGYQFFDVLDDGLFVEFADGTAHMTGTLVAQSNPNAFLAFDVWMENGLSWDDWSNQTFPTSFKDDCGIITDEYLDYTYYLMTEGAATLTGSGDLAGTEFELLHAPVNNYYGYQVGVAANNVNGSYGNGGWFTGTGTLVDAVTQSTIELEGFQGDFAFRAECCPQYTVERTWTATDCTGNTTTWTQTISFEDLGDDEEEGGAIAEGINFDEVNTDLFIDNIFPNPVRDIARVNYGVSKASVVTLDVLDMNGNLIQTLYTGSAEPGVTYQEMFETSNIESGVYMIRLSSNQSAQMERVVVAK
ncbi:MAG: T9SS type A sorting domain-containing protein [Flavobacteriales bacterium]